MIEPWGPSQLQLQMKNVDQSFWPHHEIKWYEIHFTYLCGTVWSQRTSIYSRLDFSNTFTSLRLKVLWAVSFHY